MAVGREAFIWDPVHGMRNLRTVAVTEHGLDLTGWTLTHALAMSADGRVIVGAGFNPDGNLEAWIIRDTATGVTEPSTLALASIGGVAFVVCGWRRRR